MKTVTYKFRNLPTQDDPSNSDDAHHLPVTAGRYDHRIWMILEKTIVSEHSERNRSTQ